MAERRALLAPALALALLPSAVHAAWKVTPSVEVRETWSDNPSLRPDGEKHSQFVTSVTPGISVSNQTPWLRVSAAYQMSAFVYSGNREAGTNRITNSLNANASGTVINDMLYVDASAGITQTPVSAFGPVSDNPYSDTNRAEVRSWRIAPYFVHDFGSFAGVTLRYSHDLVDSDAAGFARSSSDAMSLSVNSGRSFRTVGWGLQLNRENVDDSIAPEAVNSKALASLRYTLTSTLSLTATSGYDKFDYEDGNGQSTKGASWSAGFAYNPSQRTSLTMSAGHRYYGNSYFLAASHRSRQTVWSINYSDDVSTSRSNFLLPSTVDTAALLNQMFMANFPNPLLRALAVEAYIRNMGLPRSLPNAINYFSNRYTLQRQFNASVALRSARVTTMATVYKTRREALSLVQYDSALLGPGQQNINDNTDQTGMSVMVDYRIGSRTNAGLSATVYRSVSRSGDFSERNRAYRASVSHTFGPKVNGGLEIRRGTGGYALQGGSYTENAVAASLSMRF